MSRKFLLLAFLLGLLFSLQAQAQQCATTVRPADEQLEKGFQALWKQHRPSRHTPVKLKISVYILQFNGTINAASIGAVRQAIDSANVEFAESGLSFEACSFTIIPDNDLFNFANDEEVDLRAAGHTDSTINLYITGQVSIFTPPSTYTAVCGYAYLPGSNTYDMLVVGGSCLGTGTLTHELGHFFNLYHTHETFYGSELVNGSNCTVAGDLLCGTPADPLLGGSNVNGSCLYTGAQLDSLGDPYAPDVRNIMSYAPAACRNRFSSDQLARMRFSYDNFQTHLVEYNFGYAQTDTLICPGTSVTLGVTGTASNFNWGTNDTTATITVSPSASTTYILFFDADSCSFMKTFTVFVLPQFTFNSSTTSTTCPGSPRSLSVLSSNANYTYQLLVDSVPTGAAQQGNGATLSFSTDPLWASATARMQVTSILLGCSYVLTASHSLNVHPIPDQNVQLASSEDSICSGTSVNFSVFPTLSNLRYRISNGTTATSLVFGNNDTLFFNFYISAAGTDTFYVEIVTTCSTYVGLQSIIVHSLAHPLAVTATLVEDTVCPGSPAYFLIPQSEAGVSYRVGPVFNYVFSLGTGDTLLAPSPPITTGANVGVVAISPFGCTTTLVSSTPVRVEAMQTNASFQWGGSNIFTVYLVAGDTISCYNAGSSGVSHSWQIFTDSQTFIIDTLKHSAIYTFNADGTFPVYYTGMTRHGCVLYDTLTVKVVPLAMGNAGSICNLVDTCFNLLPYVMHNDPCGNTITGGYQRIFFDRKIPWLMKTDPQGNMLWTKSNSITFRFSDGSGVFSSLATDSSGSIYAGGSYGSEGLYVDGVLAGLITSYENTRPFLVKYDGNGNAIWHITGEYSGAAGYFAGFTSLTMGPNGHLYAILHATTTVDIYFTDTVINTGPTRPAYVIYEIDSAGQFISAIVLERNWTASTEFNPSIRFLDYNSIWTRELFAQSPSLAFRRDGSMLFSGVCFSRFRDTLYFDSSLYLAPADTEAVYFFAIHDSTGWQHVEKVASIRELSDHVAYAQLDSRDNIYYGVVPYSAEHYVPYPPASVSWKVGPDSVHGWFRAALLRYDAGGQFSWKRKTSNAYWYNQAVDKNGNTGILLLAYNGINSFETESPDSIRFTDTYGGSVLLTYGDDGSLQDLLRLHDGTSFGRTKGLVADENGDWLISGYGAPYFSLPGQVPDNCGSNVRLVALKYSPSALCGIPHCVDSLSVMPALNILSVTPGVLCAGDSLTVSFDVQDLAVLPGNMFTLVLSSSGMLTHGYRLDSLVSTTGGNFHCALPTGLPEGNYYLRVTSTQPLFNGTTYLVSIHVNALPQPLITAAGPNLSAGTTYSTYQWSFNGSPITGATDSTYVAGAIGSYSVEVTDSAGCTGSDSYYFNPAGLNDPALTGFSVWPNPITGSLNFSRASNEKAELKISDATGRLVFQKSVKESEGQIDVSFLQPGIYIVEMGDYRVRVVRS